VCVKSSLEDRLSLKQICEELHAHGYYLRSHVPFVKVKENGRRVPNVSALSRAFHNWFYAGWVVIDTDWGQIPPKTVRGSWQPIVTTDEFEAGLAILDKRNRERCHHKKHFYMLQGRIFLQTEPDTVIKLTCSMPNANRDRGGVAYYCVPSSNSNFLCHEIDKQVAAWMHNIEVGEQYLCQLREAYLAELKGFSGRSRRDERTTLEKTLKDLADEELRCARLHARNQMSDETWEALWREWQDQRSTIKVTLEAMNRNFEVHIATLDDALQLIAKAGILFNRLPPQGQQELVRHMVKRVVINPEGQILRMELRTPFSYLHQLAAETSAAPTSKRGSGSGKKQTSRLDAAGSFQVAVGGPSRIRTCDQPVMSRWL
jgi:hypothetical protein